MAKSRRDLAVTREFGLRVQAARIALKLSQEKLAEHVGMDRMSISKIERGKGNPKLLTMNKPALALDERFADFFPCCRTVGPAAPRDHQVRR